MLAKSTPRALALGAVLLASVALAGCIDPSPDPSGLAPRLTYEVQPFNATTLWWVGFPLPLLHGDTHPLVAGLTLLEGKAEWEIVEMGGALTLSVVGAGYVRIGATGPNAPGSVPNIEDVHWTHEHIDERLENHFSRTSVRDHYARAIQPLVLTVSETFWWGGGCGGFQDSGGGDLSSTGMWMPLTAEASPQPCVVV